jgi:hypothetical protein
MSDLHRWTQRSLALVSGAGLVFGVAGIVAPGSVSATAPLQVTTTADSGAGSLRQVLASSTNGDTIMFDSSVTGSIDLVTPLMVNSGVTITGPGADSLAIDGGNKVQDLVIGSGAIGATVSGLTLTHGAGSTGGAVQDVSGRDLTLMNDVITNSAATAGGGGIYFSGPQQVTLIDSTVSADTAPDGGGVFAEVPTSGQLVVQGSTISGNSATSGQGAAIYAEGETARSGGSTKAHAIVLPPPPPPTPPSTTPGSVAVTTSTVADNTARGTSAAVYLASLDSDSHLGANTVTANKATGLTLDTPYGSAPTLAATIVADNTADCGGVPLADSGYDVDSDGSCSFGATGSQSHSSTIDAALGALHLNGGPTETVALARTADPAYAVVPATFAVPGSSTALCASADQRGVLSAGSPCDSGAFQSEPAPTISSRLHSKTAKTHYGWYGSPVSVSFACQSASSAISVVCPAELALKHSGRKVAAKGTVVAQDGQSATAKVHGVNIDLVAPTVDGVKNGQTYSHAPKITCNDGLSGIASCTIHRHAHGQRVGFTVTATDKAGNTTVAKGTYTVS